MAAPSLPSTEPDALPLAAGDIVAGKYRVDELIGRGGMGAVFAATHLLLGQQFAIKAVTRSDGDGDDAVRFEREARAAAAIRSDHVVRVFDVGTTETGIPYMVMERLRGESLHDVLQRRKLTLEEIVPIAHEICDVLGEAHALGIVHRDLKPANVFLAERANRRPTTKVLDFGISKWRGSQTVKTQESALLGTPQYMAPEQATGKHDSVDARTDVFALSCVLTVCEPRHFEMPKSRTFAISTSLPSTSVGTRKMFCGLRSRWTTPSRCAAASAEPTWRRIEEI